MRNTLFKNVHVLDPSSPFHKQNVDLLIDKEGIIKQIGEVQEHEDYEVVQWDGREVCVSGGWMDMEVHLNSPGFEYKESLKELAIEAQKGGFTSILCYPNTFPVVDNGSVVSSLISQTSQFPVNFFFTGTVSEANEGQELAELYSMKEAGALAFTDGAGHNLRDDLLAKALRYSIPFDGLIINYPLLGSLAKGGQINEGKASLQLGMVPLPEAAETAALLRDIEILKYQGGRLHIQPVSSPEVIRIISEGKDQGLNLTMGMPAYYLSFSDQNLMDFDSNLKVFPPLRSPEQQVLIREYLQNGLIDVISSGHRPQGVEEKRLEFSLAEPGMINLQTFYPSLQEQVINTGLLDWDQLLEMIVINPRKILNLEIPEIKKGKKAELSFFDPNHKWELQAGSISSRAKNSPFLEKTLIGRSVGIYVSGQWVSTN
ncbi:MAG: dihydroorotase [Bacteroidia bacterium]|nr:dihydroorotase [Bacteroidia bacterium]